MASSAYPTLIVAPDAKGNKTSYEYDGFDRLKKTRFPHPSSAGTSSTTDYEELTWSDAGATRGLLAGRRLRDGTSYAYEYDDLGRLALSDAPSGTADVAYEYDLFGRLVEASGGGGTLGYAYDALGRLLSETQGLGTVAYQYNPAGRRTRAFYPGDGNFSLAYVYDWAGGLTKICVKSTIANCKTETAPAVGFSYDDLGRRVSVMRGNGVETAYGHDGASRLASLAHDPAGTGDDQSWSFDHNPAGQIVAQTAALAGWGRTMGSDYSEAYTANGLNQHLTVAGASVSHDARGNMTDDGLGRSFGYDAANRLTAVSGAGSATLAYDPAGRLREVAGTATTRFLYDGADAIAEYDETDALLRRYVHGPGADEPLVWYEGTGTGDRRFLLSDPRGSVVAVTDGAGAVTDVNKYDDYGAPASGNIGRFQFTGQMWLEEAGLYHYKARAYHPALGRFMQTDPIGYGDGMNMYAYVGNDPVNARDPSGMVEDEIIVKSGTRLPKEPSSPIYVGAGALAHFSGGGFNRGMFGGGGGVAYPKIPTPEEAEEIADEIVVTRNRAPLPYSARAIFPSRDYAGLFVGVLLQALQQKYGWEFAARLFRRGDKYGFTDARTSYLESSVQLPPRSWVPTGAQLAGSVHSHPDNVPNFHKASGGDADALREDLVERLRNQRHYIIGPNNQLCWVMDSPQSFGGLGLIYRCGPLDLGG